jgi:hypothetical protein
MACAGVATAKAKAATAINLIIGFLPCFINCNTCSTVKETQLTVVSVTRRVRTLASELEKQRQRGPGARKTATARPGVGVGGVSAP